jgi:hypothetical protein
MQSEVIKSLQMAAQYDNAVLNLALLHEASITNRQATFVTLGQMKQRLLPRMSISRHLQGSSEGSSNRRSSPTIPTATSFEPMNFVPDTYIPPAVTLPTPQDRRNSKHALTNYFTKRNSSLAKAFKLSKTPRDDINFSQAFEHLARGTKDPEVIMQEIDEIVDLYQDLSINQRSSNTWGSAPYPSGYDARRDTLITLHAGDLYSQDPLTPTQEILQMQQNLPPTSEEPSYKGYPQHPTFNNSGFDQHQDPTSYHQQYPTRNPYPQMQTQSAQPRWSTTSGSSSNYSESPSIGRNSSTSSQDASNQKPPLPLKHSSRTMSSSLSPQSMSPNASYQHHDYQKVILSSFSIPYAPTERHSESIAPLSDQQYRSQSNMPSSSHPQAQAPANVAIAPHGDYNSLMYSPYAMSHQHPQAHAIAPFEHPRQAPNPASYQDQSVATQNYTQYRSMPPAARDTPPLSGGSNTSHPQPPGNSFGTAPNITRLRHGSITPSIASTDSSGSNSIGIRPGSRMKSVRSDTIQSGPAGQERMMDGRPCKTNNYWGFCKGAWSTREDVKKGLALRTQPSGMYNTKEIWQCTSCTFKGTTFSAPHPTKKNKEITVVDPRIVISASQIRYKWIFLAKSHIKKKAVDSHSEDTNYGCVFCSLEDRVSSVYGGVETLMNHIALCHVADMSENVRRKARCVIGRVPGEGETEWDINIPIFARVEELP